MTKTVLHILYAIGVLGIICSWTYGHYNAIATAEENVENAWARVETEYQRRADLIPNLVAVVQGYSKHEENTFTQIAETRAKSTKITIDPSRVTPEQLAAYQSAQGELNQALGRIMAIAEGYPDLKANEEFRKLQSQLESTENRITYARDLFNRTTQKYNNMIRKFPDNMVASVFGFDRKPYFQADQPEE
ncbi:MAG: LemA family protein [Paludibacteraceae bacterium]|nr:LemA family protein [Paludibacteraceae bacterium]